MESQLRYRKGSDSTTIIKKQHYICEPSQKESIMTDRTIATQLEHARLTLSIMDSNEELRTRLAPFGYDEAELANGQALFDAASQAHTANLVAKANKLAATDALQRTRSALYKAMCNVSRILMLVYANDRDILERLALRPARRPNGASGKPSPVPHQIARAQAALLNQAQILYSQLLATPTILQTISPMGYTSQRLQTEQSLITTLQNLETQQETLKVDAKNQVKLQNNSLEALNKWIQRLHVVAKVALRDQPELLAKLLF